MSCVHHWLIETPTTGSPMVLGYCKNCAEERSFYVHTKFDRTGRWSDSKTAVYGEKVVY